MRCPIWSSSRFSLFSGCSPVAWSSLVLLLLAACQDELPAATPRALVPPPDQMLPGRLILPGLPVLVVAPDGMAPEAARTLAAAVAARLVDDDILASTRSPAAQSYILSSVATDAGLAATLLRPDGLVARHFVVAAPGLPTATAEDLAAAARRLADAVARSDLDAPPPPPAPRPPVRLVAVTGAPGDGARSLAAALAQALAVRGVALAGADPAALGIVVAVALGPDIGGRQRVTMNWTLTDPSGTVLGQVSQANDVPAGSLDRAWGATAAAAAAGGAAGLLALLDAVAEQADPGQVAQPGSAEPGR